LAEETGVINRKGTWYSYNDNNIGQGRDNSSKYLEENPEIALEVEQKVREQLELGALVSANSVVQPHDEPDAERSEEYSDD
jgi:recombination protein RecA